MEQGIELFKFLISNIGPVLTILFVLLLVPCIMAFMLYKLMTKMQSTQEDKLDALITSVSLLSADLKELTGHFDGALQVIKMFMPKEGGTTNES